MLKKHLTMRGLLTRERARCSMQAIFSFFIWSKVHRRQQKNQFWKIAAKKCERISPDKGSKWWMIHQKIFLLHISQFSKSGEKCEISQQRNGGRGWWWIRIFFSNLKTTVKEKLKKSWRKVGEVGGASRAIWADLQLTWTVTYHLLPTSSNLLPLKGKVGIFCLQQELLNLPGTFCRFPSHFPQTST